MIPTDFIFDIAQFSNVLLGLLIGLLFYLVFLGRSNKSVQENSAIDYQTRAGRYSAFSELVLTLVFPISAVGVIGAVIVVILSGSGKEHLVVLVAILPTLLSGTGKLLEVFRGKSIVDKAQNGNTGA